ncbi:MAG: hypothetical protein R2838_19180 [Caldilineaceae bacterium]
MAGDIYRPATIQQLQILGNQIDVPVYSEGTEVAASTIARTRCARPGRRPTPSSSWTPPDACRSTSR